MRAQRPAPSKQSSKAAPVKTADSRPRSKEAPRRPSAHTGLSRPGPASPGPAPTQASPAPHVSPQSCHPQSHTACKSFDVHAPSKQTDLVASPPFSWSAYRLGNTCMPSKQTDQDMVAAPPFSYLLLAPSSRAVSRVGPVLGLDTASMVREHPSESESQT